MLLWDLFGHFPGTDYESFNYEWIIGKLKELKDSVAAAKASEDAAADSADGAHVSMLAATAQAAHSKAYAEHSADSAAESAASAAESASSAATAKNYADNIADPVSGIVTTWLSNNISGESEVILDRSLTVLGAAADAEATGAAIRNIAKASANIFNKYDTDNIKDGYFFSYNNQALTANSDYIAFLVKVEPGTTYTCTGMSYPCAYLTDAQVYISHNSFDDLGAPCTFTTPANCYYVWINVNKTDTYPYDEFMVVKGLVLPDTYVPYQLTLNEWVKSASDKTYHVGPTRTYTSFTALIEDLADDESMKTIYIDPGVYDIYQEIGGDTFAETVNTSNWLDWSVLIPNNTKIIGLGDVTFKFDIPDSITSHAPNILSPINVRQSVSIENITIRCSNCRYGIHDDGSGTYDNTKHYYKDVVIFKGPGGYDQAFGAGIGPGSEFTFDNCVFSGKVAMSFHNRTATSPFYGKININNCTLIGQTEYSGLILGSVSATDSTRYNTVNVTNSKIKPKAVIRPESGYGTPRTECYKTVFANCNADLVIDNQFDTNIFPPTVL